MGNTTFIYALCEPGTRTVRYIGKADNPKRRLGNHLAAARKGQETYACRWMRQLLSAGTKPQLFVLGEVPLSSWESAEKNVIAAARAFGMNITNTTEGGDGVVNPSPEARERRRQRMLGRVPWNKGKVVWSAEERKRIGDQQRGIPRPKSPEHLINNGLARRGLKRSEANRAKLSAVHFGRKTARNTSGFVGVSKRPNGKYHASFELRGKYFHVGSFSKIEDAVFARSLAVENL